MISKLDTFDNTTIEIQQKHCLWLLLLLKLYHQQAHRSFLCIVFNDNMFFFVPATQYDINRVHGAVHIYVM